MNDFVPVKGTVVKSLAKPWGAVEPEAVDRRLVGDHERVRARRELGHPLSALVSVIVIPGPTVPVNFGAAASDADIGGRAYGCS